MELWSAQRRVAPWEAPYLGSLSFSLPVREQLTEWPGRPPQSGQVAGLLRALDTVVTGSLPTPQLRLSVAGCCVGQGQWGVALPSCAHDAERVQWSRGPQRP